ncbi:hypothetical protein M501DRAFT_998650 [Patellaria atrata CBS 101060]|uniref:Uncharacterized protein n=1 Tax=Patellaria atrata CBS 101060 TaxID=1346257 RepID=A0A9P4VST3_9PEZI|nr:hypothetical protein M501DRAFT_998650 [Patellaria atrata CBS 101060]
MNTSSRAGHDRSHSPEMTESPHRLPTQEQLLEKMVTWHGEMLSQMAHSNEMLRKLISSARDSDDLQDLEYGLRRVETGQSMRQGSGKGGLDRGCRRRWFDSDEEDEWYSSPRGKSRVLRMSNRGFKEGEADIHGRRMKRRGTGQSYPDYTSESDDSSRGTSSSSSMSNVFYGENVFSREEMDALMKKEYPGVKEYKGIFTPE